MIPQPHTPFSTTDPWTQVLNRLWAILEANAAFAALVKPGNRIKFTDTANQNPIKENIQAGDLPEVTIEPTTAQDQWAYTSTSVGFTQVWSVKLATNDMRLVGAASPLRWIVVKTLFEAGDKIGLDFVVSTRISPCLLNTYDPVENRGTKGWTVLCTLTTVLELRKNPDGTLAD